MLGSHQSTLTLLLDPFIPDVQLDRDPAAGGAAAAGAAEGGALALGQRLVGEVRRGEARVVVMGRVRPAWWCCHMDSIIATGERTAHLLPARLGALVGGLVGMPVLLGVLWGRAWGWSGG